MMIRVVFIALVLALTESQGVPNPNQLEVDKRIIGGGDADITDFPYQVSLYYSSIIVTIFICGGSILNSNTILTAAHCTDGNPASRLTVRAGSTYRGSGGTVYSVSKIVQHPAYNAATFNNDISLLKLSTNIQFDNTMRAISLPVQNAKVANAAEMVVSGWGYTTPLGVILPDHLQKVIVNKIDTATCNSKYQPNLTVNENMICAAAPGKDACQGDSGGPLTIGLTQYGIVSWGVGCGDSRYPGVYTRVAVYVNWINAN